MKNLKKVLAVVLALAFATVMFAGCGSKNVNESGKVKVIDIPLTSEEYAFAVSQDNTDLLNKVNDFLKEIQKNGKFDEICNNYFGDGTPNKFKSAELDTSKEQLVVATATGFEPFEMVDGEGYYGVDLEIAKLLGDSLGLEVVIQDMEFDSVINSVQSGNSSIAMAGLSVTAERQKVVTFTNTYYNASQIVVVNQENTAFDDCTDAESVEKVLKGFDKNVKIGCQAGTTGELYAKGSKDSGFEGFTAKASAYKYAALAITAMQQGQVECVIVDNGPAKAISSKINAE